MALLISKVDLASGLTVNNAYARIDTFSGSKNGIDFSLNYYISQDAFNAGSAYIKNEQYSFVPSVSDNAPNFIKQGYEYLKALPAFAGAVDVLEEIP